MSEMVGRTYCLQQVLCDSGNDMVGKAEGRSADAKLRGYKNNTPGAAVPIHLIIVKERDPGKCVGHKQDRQPRTLLTWMLRQFQLKHRR